MNETSYKVSEITKEKLINAAGKLFAKQGTDNVTVKQICELAGTKVNSISYHFGGKDGLIKALWDRVLEKWRKISFTAYINENRHLIKTKDGKIQLVSEMIDLFYDMLYPKSESEFWITKFISIGLFKSENKKFFSDILENDSPGIAFPYLYKMITGNDDDYTANCWLICIVAPAMFIIPNQEALTNGFIYIPVDNTFYRRLKKEAIRNALLSIGLIKA